MDTNIQKITNEQIYDEIEQLKDLFLRRLMDDKVKSQVIAELIAKTDALRLEPLFKDFILLIDRVEAANVDDFALSIVDELLVIGERYGLEQIATAEVFSPSTQRAVESVEDRNRKNGDVLSVVRKGYTLNGVVIRPENVVIVMNRKEGSGQSRAAGSDEATTEHLAEPCQDISDRSADKGL